MRLPRLNLSLVQASVLAVSGVLLAVQIPSVYSDIRHERHDIEIGAEREAVAALDMLEAVHIQSMLNRGQTQDGDPAIETLNGAMAQVSELDSDAKVWLFMGQKVIDFQIAAGQTEIEPPLDAVDRAAIASKEPREAFSGTTFRLSRPVILGEGHASDPRCAECHGGLMGIQPGEVIGGYSVALNLAGPLGHWNRGIYRRIAWGVAILTSTIAAIMLLLGIAALEPLDRLARITQKLANGDTDVDEIGLQNRKDALGTMARSLQVFRDSLIAKERLEADNAAANTRLQYLASHDALTGLPNRAVFREWIDEALSTRPEAANSRLAVVCVDIDHFKEVNDTRGHGTGDAVLQVVAEKLRKAVGEAGFAARLGGDEFALVLSQADDASAVEQVCQKLLASVSEGVDLDGRKLPLTVSLGVAMAPVDGDSAEDILRHADTALYGAKSEGRNTYRFFSAEMNVAIEERRRIEHDLRDAFERGELDLHYQPLVDVKSDKIVGVEALMRWKHAERGWISPGVFIPVAESCGLIGPMGRWLLETACAQAVWWPGIRMSVNISPAQFREKDLVAFVAETLRKTGLPPDRLELEITEGLLLLDSHRPLETLLELKALGVRIAMDDFGTGYSSLGYLQSFPFDKIKIDRSFVGCLENDANAAAIVRSVVALGQSLGMVTTAEGVETPEQLAFLRNQNCDQAQGYLLAKPQDALSVTTLIAGWRSRKASVDGLRKRA